MNAATAASITAVAVSLMSLCLSTFIAVRQTRLSHNANQLPVALELYRILRSPEYHRNEERLWRELPGLKARPISELPYELREALASVGLVYQLLAYLIALDVVDERMAILPVHFRIVRTWEVAEPFVKAERTARGYELSYFNLFEALAQRVTAMDIGHSVDPFVERLRR